MSLICSEERPPPLDPPVARSCDLRPGARCEAFRGSSSGRSDAWRPTFQVRGLAGWDRQPSHLHGRQRETLYQQPATEPPLSKALRLRIEETSECDAVTAMKCW